MKVKRSVMGRWAKANPGTTDLVSVNVQMTDDEARAMVDSLQYCIQYVPGAWRTKDMDAAIDLLAALKQVIT